MITLIRELEKQQLGDNLQLVKKVLGHRYWSVTNFEKKDASSATKAEDLVLFSR